MFFFFYKREHAVFRLFSREHPDFSLSFILFFTMRHPRYGPAQLLLSLQHDSPRLHQRLNIWTGRTACVKKGITMSFALTREGIKPVAKGFALALALFQIWFTTGFGVLDGSMMRVMFVSFITVLVFLFIPGRKYKENEKEPTLFLLIDLCCAGLAIATAVYFALHLTEITTRMRYIDDVTPGGQILRRRNGPARPRNHPPHHGLGAGHRGLDAYPGIAFFGEAAAPRRRCWLVSPSTSSSNIFFLLNEACTRHPDRRGDDPVRVHHVRGVPRTLQDEFIFMDLACLLTRARRADPPRSPFLPPPCSGPSREAPPPTSTAPAPSPSRS